MNLEKIKIITDSACDIPVQDERELDITVLPIPMIIDGESYYERRDFTAQEYYKKLVAAKSIPTTSHIPSTVYAEQYGQCYRAGYTDVIVITICSKGSEMFSAATLAIEMFYDEVPEARERMRVHVVDSLSYTMVFGYGVVMAARMAKEGHGVQHILDALDRYYNSVEIYFSTYTLEFAKKSGRISAAASFAGDVLGLRPIISIIDGDIKIIDKVRGDKKVVPKLIEKALSSRVGDDSLVMCCYGSRPEARDEVEAQWKKATGRPVDLCFEAGASIATNSGPQVVAVIVMGRYRGSKQG